MNRVVLSDGHWFDADAAQRWDRDDFRGVQTLWRTKPGSFILETRDGLDQTTFTFWSEDVAVAWMLKHGFEDVPDDLAHIVEDLQV